MFKLSFNNWKIFPIFLIVLIGIIVYSNSFQVPFQLDDVSTIVKNPVMQSLRHFREIYRYDPTRFLTHLTFMVNFRIGELNVFGYHIVNFILHCLNSVLFYYLLQLTLRLPVFRGQDKLLSGFLPLFCSLIFLVHPVQTQAVTYIVQRSILLAAAFYFLGIILYIKSRDRFQWPLYGLMWAVALLGSMTKPIFVTLPFTVLLYEFCFYQSSRHDIKKIFFTALPFFSVLVLIPLFLIIFTMNFLGESFDWTKLGYATRVTSEVGRMEYLLTQFRVIVTYLRLLFIPVGQNVDYDYNLSSSLFTLETFLPFLFLAFLFVGALMTRKKFTLISFSILWFFILMIPESSVFPLPDVIFEHRLYMAVACFAIFLVEVLHLLVTKTRRAEVYLLLAILSLSIMTYTRNIVWRDPVTLLEDAIEKSPNKPRPHSVLGAFYQREGSFALAEKAFLQAIALDPQYVDVYNHLGTIYAKQKKYDKAMVQFKTALQKMPHHFEANLNMGDLYFRQGKLEFASAQYLKAKALKPLSALPYYKLGKLYSRGNERSQAENYFKKAITLNPSYIDALYELGNIYLVKEQYREAIEVYEKIIAIRPRYADAYNTLGIALINTGQPGQAEQYFKRSLKLNPDNVVASLNLSEYYRQQGNTQKAEYYSNLAKEKQKP